MIKSVLPLGRRFLSSKIRRLLKVGFEVGVIVVRRSGNHLQTQLAGEGRPLGTVRVILGVVSRIDLVIAFHQTMTFNARTDPVLRPAAQQQVQDTFKFVFLQQRLDLNAQFWLNCD